jgi:hypothetical protein
MNDLAVPLLLVALLASLIANVWLGVWARQATGRRAYTEIALARCTEDRQAAMRRNADDKLVRTARMVVAAVAALPDDVTVGDGGDLWKAVGRLGVYLDHLDAKNGSAPWT